MGRSLGVCVRGRGAGCHRPFGSVGGVDVERRSGAVSTRFVVVCGRIWLQTTAAALSSTLLSFIELGSGRPVAEAEME